MNNVLTAIQANLKTAYQQAIDADKMLDALATKGLGKFSNIFADDSIFSAKEKRFMPYVIELNADFENIKSLVEPDQELLVIFVKKLDLFFSTVKTFVQTAKK